MSPQRTTTWYRHRRISGSSFLYSRESVIERERVSPEENRPFSDGSLIAIPSTVVTARRARWHDELTPSHWRILFASFLGWTFDGYESYALFIVLPFALQDILTPMQARSTAVWAGIAISTTL